MKKFVICMIIFAMAMVADAGLNDRMSEINLLDGPQAVELPEITAPAGNPNPNKAWIYSKDVSGTSSVFVEQDDGTVTDILSKSYIDSLTLDDGSGASPSLIFKDATDETATFSKGDGTDLTLTTEAADGLQILGGNLCVGNGTPDVALDGEDAYVEGTLETDGAVRLDGAVSANSTVTVSGALTANGDVNFGSFNEKTIAAGEITMTKSVADVDTEDYAASDDLDTISGGTAGDILIIKAEHNDRTVVVKDDTGNVQGSGDCTLDNVQDTWSGVFDGSNWLELACVDNGA